MKFYKDKSGDLGSIFKRVVAKHFKNDPITLAKIQYVFWEGEKTTNDGRIIHGEARIPSPRERDIYGFDFIISVYDEYWNEDASARDKIRLAYHELNHCIVMCEESTGKAFVPKRDKEGRLKVKINPHDVNLNLFLGEVKLCGLADDEENFVEALSMTAKNFKRRMKTKKPKKKKKK